MVKLSYSDKLKDPRWQKMRLEVFQRQNFTCQYCGETELSLHAHHLCYSTTYNPWDVDISAILCLCEKCHQIEHLKDLTEFEKGLITRIHNWAQIYDGKDRITNLMIRDINNFILNDRG